jgi:hypothetical protein
MKLKKLVLYAAGGFLTIAAIGAITAPRLTAAIRGAFVEIVIPSHPYSSKSFITQNPVSTGPDTGTLGVTSITLTNYDTIPHMINIASAVVTGGDCTTGTLMTGTDAITSVLVPATQTLHLTYPSPLTFSSVSGHTCVFGGVLGTIPNAGTAIRMDINGFVN